MNDPVFARYARYYDLLYREKDYPGEARLVDGMLRRAGASPGALLDVGCGTGAHAREFATLGWRVTGIDVAPMMIAMAEARKPAGSAIEFVTGSAADFDLGRKFAAAVSLFHVASYQVSCDELGRMCRNVRRHLNDGGVFVFDFWHGPGVLHSPPEVRVRELEGDGLHVTRTATPTHRREECIVDVNYDLVIEDRRNDAQDRLSETHRMRYFFRAEIKAVLAETGFVPQRLHAGISEDELGDEAWFGLVVAKAIS